MDASPRVFSGNPGGEWGGKARTEQGQDEGKARVRRGQGEGKGVSYLVKF
ncbi:hypothetical protein E2C01_055802 [Portunus trituberculatus]|uniref:Uncharacterized protein n=1 Tax=Portunus trituberculatus TaxID=210409 RepID=A0A5B7GWY8_PORTR|nr:hypothetical protein [Portunus trituberculatus]